MAARAKSAVQMPPRHIAIIMDGNGRWARARMLPRVAGHRRGAEAVRRSVEACIELGVDYLTLYAFSSENWKRPVEEVDDLMGLLRLYLKQELRELHRNGVRVRFIGGRDKLASDIIALIEEAERTTAGNRRLNLVIALNYGSQAEIVSAARHLAREVLAGRMQVEDIDEAAFARHLDTHGMPDPDLIIRTSGEKRLSNFLLWQSAYAELIFTDIYWPDFDKNALAAAIDEY
ncbi:MAG: isoprenyl transferase, partial [Alphaproteobacteria bacterium]